MTRRWIRALVIIGTLLVGASTAAVIATQTAWFRNWLRGFIVKQAGKTLNAELSIGRLNGNLFRGVELENVVLAVDGREAVSIGKVGVAYNAFQLITRGIAIDQIRLDRPVIHLWRTGDSWELAKLIKKEEREADRSGPGRPIAISRIVLVEGSVFIDDATEAERLHAPSRFERLDAVLAFHYEPVRYSVDITRASFRGSDPDLTLNELSGAVAVRNDTVYMNGIAVRTAESSLRIDGVVERYQTKPVLRLKAASEKISLPEIARLVPGLSGRPLAPAFEVTLDGPLSQLNVALDVRSSAGDVSGHVVADLDGSQQSVVGDVGARHLDLGPILADKALASDISTNAHADLHFAALGRFDTWQGTTTFNGPHIAIVGLAGDNVNGSARFAGGNVLIDTRAAAYGARVTAAGRLMLPRKQAPFSYDLRGGVRAVNLQKLPPALKMPPANTSLNADYHVTGSGSRSVAVDAVLLDSTVAEAHIAVPTTASFALSGQDVSYSADATVGDVDLQRIGRAFRIGALDNVRYQSALNGHVVVSGSGTSAASLEIRAGVTLTNSSLSSGRLDSLTLDTTLAADTLHVKASGAFRDVDPGALAGKPAASGRLAGTLEIDATAADISRGFTIDSVQAEGRVGLGASTVGGLSIDDAMVDGTYRNGNAQIRQLSLHGPDVNAEAKGTLVLNEAGQSNLVVHADTPSLEAVARLIDQKASGFARADATITGNGRDLRAAGTLAANDLEYKGQSALQLSSDFTIQATNFAFAHAQISARTKSTFVVIGGQDINELTAQTDYCDKTLVFDVAAKQPKRSLSAGGSLTLDPDQDRLSLTRLALQTQDVEWQTAPAARAEIRYGGGAVSVQGLRLLSGNQEIEVGGAFGRPEGTLVATARNLNLAAIDALMLRPPMLSGTVNASAEITGTNKAPKVAGKFDVTNGAFRQVHFNAFTGTVDYEGSGITLDTKLEQSATNRLEVNGYVPVAAFRKAAADGDRHLESQSKADSFDLHVKSTAVDLGLVQGATTAVTNVSGTVEAAIDVTGPAGDPHPGGVISVRNGALTVVPTGATYTNLNGRIELEADRIHIVDIEVLDNDKQSLSIVGDLALHEQQLGGVNVYVTARNFKIIKNTLGDLRMDSDLLITGEMLRPRIEGDLGVTSGVINLDPLIESITGAGGATAETAYRTRGGGAGRARSADGTPGSATTPADPALVERINAPEGSAGLDAPTASNRGAATDAQPASGSGAPSRRGAEGGFSALSMDVHLAVADDFVIRTNDLAVPDAPIGLGAVNVTIGGDLRLVKTPGRDVVRLVGTVNTVRGTYDFQGRRFTILRDGTIRFEGGRDIDPDLSVSAQRAIQGVLANVNVRGTLKKPELVLSSVPPLEQSEILSLIVFNQPINQLGEGEQVAVAQRAQQLAAGALASTLTNSLGKALNLTEFSVQTGTDSRTAAQITAGEQVNENLYAKVEQGFGDASTTNFVLEYEIAKWLRLRTNWLQGSNAQPLLFQRTQDSGLDLLFTFSR